MPRSIPTKPLALLLALAALVAMLAGCSACRGASDTAPQAPAAEEPGLRLVVLLVVDQLPSWSFSRDAELLRTREGGIGRLLGEGVHYTEAVFPYALTYTAPGHATLATGAPPSVHGILANGWYRPALGEVLGAMDDPDYPVFAPDGGLLDGAGASGRQLRVDGVADVLERETGGAAVTVSVSVKDRAAAFQIGRRPDVAVWFDNEHVAMTTSRYYADELPAWLRALAARHSIDERLDWVWTPRDPALLARVTGIDDDGIGEGGAYGLGTTFPHDLGAVDRPGQALRTTPLGDELVLETGLAAIEALGMGKDDVPDLLALSFSSHDYAGHAWGQESWERLEVLLALDEMIGRLLDALDERVGPDRYAVLLTSDHGAVRLIEHSVAAGRPAWRVSTRTIRDTAEDAARAVLGDGDWVLTASAATLHLSGALAERPPEERERAIDAMLEAIRALDGVGYAVRTDRVTGDCDAREGLDALVCRAILAGDSGDIFFAVQPDSLLASEHGTGTSHGTPNPDDLTVPILLRVPGAAPRVIAEQVSMLQVAPTLAALLGVPVPEAANAPPLAP